MCVMSYSKMKPARKKELLRWLRKPADQGGYLQGRDQLLTIRRQGDRLWDDEFLAYTISEVDDHRFCCLGVCTNIMVEKGLVTWDDMIIEAPMDKTSHVSFHYLFDAALPSQEILDYWGISNRAADKLARMNDAGRTFLEIADWIEKNL